MNQILEIALRSYSNSAPDNWSHLLHAFALSYNSTPHSATSFSPSFLLYGFHPLSFSIFLHPPTDSISWPNPAKLVFASSFEVQESRPALSEHHREQTSRIDPSRIQDISQSSQASPPICTNCTAKKLQPRMAEYRIQSRQFGPNQHALFRIIAWRERARQEVTL